MQRTRPPRPYHVSLTGGRRSAASSGFSLIIVSILVTVAAIVLASVLAGGKSGDYNAKSISNVEKLERVEEAMRSFMAFNGRRPCPADGQYAVGNVNFGVEAANPANCTGGTPAAPMGPDAATGQIVASVIPTRSLNLPDDDAFDEFGRRFTYVVDARATGNSSCISLEGITSSSSPPTGTGGLIIHDGTGATIDNTMYAYISHGPSGYGAFPVQGSTVSGRINSGSNDADMQTNARVDSNFNYSTSNFTDVRIKKDRVRPNTTPGDTGFDDLVWYRSDLKNICGLGPKMVKPGFVINGFTATQWSGFSVTVGDVNGDGIPDLIIGAQYASPGGLSSAGAVYVVFGTRTGLPDPLPLNSLNGENGVEFDGAASNDWAGFSVAAGDINGDGISDLIIDAPTNGGSVYVVFGKKGGWSGAPTTLNSAFFNGTNGVEFDGAVGNGKNQVTTGDINDDGIADLIIGAPDASPGGAVQAGSIYVMFGKKNGWPTSSYNLGGL